MTNVVDTRAVVKTLSEDLRSVARWLGHSSPGILVQPRVNREPSRNLLNPMTMNYIWNCQIVVCVIKIKVLSAPLTICILLQLDRLQSLGLGKSGHHLKTNYRFVQARNGRNATRYELSGGSVSLSASWACFFAGLILMSLWSCFNNVFLCWSNL